MKSAADGLASSWTSQAHPDYCRIDRIRCIFLRTFMVSAKLGELECDACNWGVRGRFTVDVGSDMLEGCRSGASGRTWKSV